MYTSNHFLSLGPYSPQETRLQTNPLALLPLFDFVPGPYKYRQRQSRWPSGRSRPLELAIQHEFDNLLHQLLCL